MSVESLLITVFIQDFTIGWAQVTSHASGLPLAQEIRVTPSGFMVFVPVESNGFKLCGHLNGGRRSVDHIVLISLLEFSRE